MKSAKELLSEQLQSPTLAEENLDNSTSSTQTFEQLKGTPFFITGNKTDGYFAVLGQHQITEPFENEIALITYINEKPYELLITLMNVVFSFRQDHPELYEKAPSAQG